MSKYILLLLLSFCFVACINHSEPMFHFIKGEVQDLRWDENGFMKMNFKTENDSIITTLTDIKYVDRNRAITRTLKNGQLIEIKGIKDCPISFGGFFGKEKDNCYIEIREFRIPEENNKN